MKNFYCFLIFIVFLNSAASLTQTGAPFIENIVDCGGAQLPAGVYDDFSKRTFIVYPGCSGGLDELCSVDPYIIYYDHQSQSWSAPLKVGTSPISNDTHCNPQLVIDSQHYLHVFNGGHGHPIQHFKSIVQTHHSDVLSGSNWQTQSFQNSSLQDRATYLTAVQDVQNDIYVFYRQTIKGVSDPYWYEPIYYIKSADDGQTWNEPVCFVDPGYDTDNWNTIYRRGIYFDKKTNKLHYTFALTFEHNTHWENVYYVCFDLDQDKCFTPSGTDLGNTVNRTEFENPNNHMYLFTYTENVPHYCITDVSIDPLGQVNVIQSEESDNSGITTVLRKIWTGYQWTEENLFPDNTHKIGVWGVEYGDVDHYNLFVHKRSADNSLDELKILKRRQDGQSEESVISYSYPPGAGFFTAFEEIVNAHPDLRRTFMWCDPHGWWQPEPTGKMYAWGDRGTISTAGLSGPVSTVIDFSPNKIASNDGYTLNIERAGKPYYGELDFELKFCETDFNHLANTSDKWTYTAFDGKVHVPSNQNVPPGIYMARFKAHGSLDEEYSDFDVLLVDNFNSLNNLNYTQTKIQPPPPGSYMIFESRDANGNFVGYTRIDIETDMAEFGGHAMRMTKTGRQAYWNAGGRNCIRFGYEDIELDQTSDHWLVSPGWTVHNSSISLENLAQAVNVFYDGNGFDHTSTQGLLGGVTREYVTLIENVQDEMEFHYSLLTPNYLVPYNLSLEPQTFVELAFGFDDYDGQGSYIVDLWHVEALEPTTSQATLRTRYIETGGQINENSTTIRWSVTEDWQWRQDGILEKITQWVNVDPLCWRGGSYDCETSGSLIVDNSLIDWYIPDDQPLTIHFKDLQSGALVDNLNINSGDPYQVVVTKANGTPYSGFLQLWVEGEMSLWRDLESKPIYVSNGVVNQDSRAYGNLDDWAIQFRVRPYLTNSSINSLYPVQDQDLLPNTSFAAFSNKITLSIGDNTQKMFTLQVEGQGTVEVNPLDIYCTDQYQSSYDFATNLYLKTNPADGNRFSHWLVNNKRYNANQCDLTLTQDTNVTAIFVPGNKSNSLSVAGIKYPVGSYQTLDLNVLLQRIQTTIQYNPSIDLIVTPSYSFSKIDGMNLESVPIELDYEPSTGIYTLVEGQENNRAVMVLLDILQLAQTHKVNFVLGTFAEKYLGFIFNSQLIINTKGQIIGVRRNTIDILPSPAPDYAETIAFESLYSYTLQTASDRHFTVLPLMGNEISDTRLYERAENFTCDILAVSIDAQNVLYEQITRDIYNNTFDPNTEGWIPVIKNIFIDEYILNWNIVRNEFGYLLCAMGETGIAGIINLQESPDSPLQLTTDENNIYALIQLGAFQTVDFNFERGWNLVSVPGSSEDMSITSLFSSTNLTHAYSWNGSDYDVVSTLEPGNGYWIYVPESFNVSVQLSPIYDYTRYLSANSWYMIGGVIESIGLDGLSTNPPDNYLDPVFIYNSNYREYQNTNTIEATKGYWIYIVEDGYLSVTINATPHALAKDQAISPSSLPPLPPKSTAMDDNTEKIPIEFNLAQNYPNPFNPKTTVEYSIAKKSLVYLAVFNLKGQMIKILENKIQEKGQYVTFWDGTNKNGQPVSSGVYIIRLQTKNMEKNIKALLIR